MNVWVGGRVAGGERTVTVTVTGTDDDVVRLIESLTAAGGPAAVMGAKIAASTGLVADRADDISQVARMMRHYADLLDKAAGA